MIDPVSIGLITLLSISLATSLVNTAHNIFKKEKTYISGAIGIRIKVPNNIERKAIVLYNIYKLFQNTRNNMMGTIMHEITINNNPITYYVPTNKFIIKRNIEVNHKNIEGEFYVIPINELNGSQSFEIKPYIWPHYSRERKDKLNKEAENIIDELKIKPNEFGVSDN